jgi:DNA-binding CsgD family transcriptional regulator
VPLLRLAVLDYETGDWSRALEAVDELERMTTQTGWNVNMALAHAMRALVEGMGGDIESARTRAVAALDETEQRGRLSRFPLTVLATLAMSVEDYAEAYEQLERVLARNRARDVRDPKSLCSGAEALVGLNRLQEAGALLAECEAAGPHGRPAEAAYSRARGLLAAEQGDLERGEAELAASVARWRELDLPLELGRSLLALGSVRRRARKKRDAREALDEASELFERIGARIWAERARVEAARIGGRVAPRTGLTGTEDAIAALVATGKSNREVAAALRLSTHTVEWNLARIYRKLGIHSRTQLAAARAKR